MIDFQSIQTTTDPSSPARNALDVAVRSVTPKARLTRMTQTSDAFADRDSRALCHASRGWTLPASGKSSHNTSEEQDRLVEATSEGDSNTLGHFKAQDTEIEVTAASNT